MIIAGGIIFFCLKPVKYLVIIALTKNCMNKKMVKGVIDKANYEAKKEVVKNQARHKFRSYKSNVDTSYQRFKTNRQNRKLAHKSRAAPKMRARFHGIRDKIRNRRKK